MAGTLAETRAARAHTGESMMKARNHLPIGLAFALVVLTSHVAAEQSRLPHTTSCRLTALPDQPQVRDRHTCLLANYDAVDASDAEFARAERREVGVGSQPDAPGRFGGGVAVTGSEGCV